MAKKRTAEFEKWCDGVDDETLDELYKAAKKQYHKWLLISLIPVINWVTMGKAIFCYNNICYIKSRGRTTGNSLWRFLLLLWGLYIFPLYVVKRLANNDKRGNKVLGWE